MHRLLLVALFLPVVASAQPELAPQGNLAMMDEVEVVRRTVHSLWQAMRDGDGETARAVIHPDARGYSAGMRDGQIVFMQDTPDRFIEAIGQPHDAVWDERVFNEEIRIDGPLATYYADYEFWLGDTLSHCGVDAFQLIKDEELGWRIFVLSDTRRPCEGSDG